MLLKLFLNTIHCIYSSATILTSISSITDTLVDQSVQNCMTAVLEYLDILLHLYASSGREMIFYFIISETHPIILSLHNKLFREPWLIRSDIGQ